MYEIFSDHIQYIRDIFCQESDNLKLLNQQISSLNLPRINLSPESVKIMQLILKLSKATKIIELGTHIGYSTIAIAEILDKNSEIYTIEKDIMRANLAKENFSKLGYNNIYLYQGDAFNILNDLSEYSPFDVIFIDANKSKYLEYLNWAEKNVRKYGIIIADNILLNREIFEIERGRKFSKSNIAKMRLFNQRLSDQKKYFTSIFPSKDGFAISIKLF